MQLQHIEFSKLKISKTNMRYRDPAPDVSDILPSILTKGVLQPLIVRPEDDKFGVVAGRRRWFSLKAKREKLGEVDAPPCAIMEDGDDAEAIELSLLENVARRDPDPMREYETFVRLIKEGRTVDGIAATFGLTKTQVNQRLALGNLLPSSLDTEYFRFWIESTQSKADPSEYRIARRLELRGDVSAHLEKFDDLFGPMFDRAVIRFDGVALDYDDLVDMLEDVAKQHGGKVKDEEELDKVTFNAVDGTSFYVDFKNRRLTFFWNVRKGVPDILEQLRGVRLGLSAPSQLLIA